MDTGMRYVIQVEPDTGGLAEAQWRLVKAISAMGPVVWEHIALGRLEFRTPQPLTELAIESPFHLKISSARRPYPKGAP